MREIFLIIPCIYGKKGKFDIYLKHLLTSAGGGDIIQMYKIKAVTETVAGSNTLTESSAFAESRMVRSQVKITPEPDT